MKQAKHYIGIGAMGYQPEIADGEFIIVACSVEELEAIWKKLFEKPLKRELCRLTSVASVADLEPGAAKAAKE